MFTSVRDGWAFGPALWQTTDGGTSWRRVPAPGPVAGFTVDGGRLLAVIGGCGQAGPCAYRGYAAPAGAGRWQPVPGTALTAASGLSVQLAASGPSGYLLAVTQGTGKPVLLTGPVSGAVPWRPRPEPCPGAWSRAVAAAGAWLFLGCGGDPGAGNQLKTAYTSRDGGATWRQVASPPFSGYLTGAAMSPGGTVFLSGQRMDVDISRDRGGSWQLSPSLAAPAGAAAAGFPLLATMAAGPFGAVIQQEADTRQLWLTADGGRTWTPRTVP